MMRRISCLALAFVTLASVVDAKPRKFSWELYPHVGSRKYDDSLGGLSTHGFYGIRLGYNLTRHWEIEAGWSNDPDNQDRTLFRRDMNLQNIDLGAVYNFNTGPDEVDTRGRWYSWDRWIPYVSAGLGFFSTSDRVLGSREACTVSVAAGSRIMIEDFVGIRFEVRNVNSIGEGDFDGSFNNLEGSVGATFILGGEVPRDSDGDGVLDGIDRCPNTPLGCWVDEWGCPKDSDGDGVCDGLDRCPNTWDPLESTCRHASLSIL